MAEDEMTMAAHAHMRAAEDEADQLRAEIEAERTKREAAEAELKACKSLHDEARRIAKREAEQREAALSEIEAVVEELERRATASRAGEGTWGGGYRVALREAASLLHKALGSDPHLREMKQPPSHLPAPSSEHRSATAWKCPVCGATYPVSGTCHGYGADKHEPTETEQR